MTLDYLIDCKAQRMPYWDRAKIAKQKEIVFTVYVPRPGRPTHIAPGSGIVGVANDGLPDGQTLVYFEGGLYSTQPRPYEDLVYHAADRMAVEYPTIARAVLPTDDLIQVGYFDYAKVKLLVTDQAALDAWRS